MWVVGAILVIAIVVGLIVVANNNDDNKNANTTVTKMTVGHINLANDLPAYVAQEKGFFKDENLEVTLKKLDSSKLATDALYAGGIDASAGSSTVPLLGAEATQPGKVKIYALGYTGTEADDTLGGFVVKESSDIQSPEDLAGKKIAVFPGGTAKILLTRYFNSKGIDPSGIQWVEQAPSLWAASLNSGAVDSVYAYEPQYTIFKQDKENPVRIIAYGALESNVNPLYLGGSSINVKFMTDHKDAAQAYMRAYYKGIDFIKSNESEARQILAKYTGITPEVANAMNLYPDAKLADIDKAKFQQLADILYEDKNITASVDTNTMYVDASMVKQ
jgi:NitT/TauT family transport system substrate-binding protein